MAFQIKFVRSSSIRFSYDIRTFGVLPDIIPVDPDNDMDGYTLLQGDCDDNNDLINPGMQEICNGIDDNCDDRVDEGVLNVCGYCGPVPAEVCDGIDNDCNGAVDEGFGQTTCGLGECTHTIDNCSGGVVQVCDQLQGASAEICDGLDNDCNGDIDNGVLNACGACGTVPAETCDGIDNNCNGIIDEGFDTDNDGYTVCGGDCDDNDNSVNPSASEVIGNLKDDDCNPSTWDIIGMPPQITAGDSYQVREGETLSFSVTASYPDNTAVSLKARPRIRNSEFRASRMERSICR